MKKKMAMLLAAVMAVTVLGGCGTSQTKQESAQTQKESEQTKSESAGEDDVEIAYGGDVKISTIEGPVTLYLPQSSTTGDRWFASPAAESLGRLTEDGTTQPWLAEEFITDPDALTFTIKLRDGVEFHDGSPCNADAVAWNIEQYIANGKGSEIGNPTSVTADDNLTVTVHFDEWANNWDEVIGGLHIISKEAYEKNGEEWCKIHVVGTGPFVFDSYVAGSSLKYVKNENYRIEGQPYVDSVEFVVIPDTNTQVSAFLNGEVDVLNTIDGTVIQTVQASGFENMGRESANMVSLIVRTLRIQRAI